MQWILLECPLSPSCCLWVLWAVPYAALGWSICTEKNFNKKNEQEVWCSSFACSQHIPKTGTQIVPRPVPHQFFFCCSYRADSDFPLYCVGAERSIQDFPGVRSPLNPLYKSVDWRVQFYKVLAAIVAFLILFRIIRPDDLNGLFPTG